ncbi:DNA mismatch repair protein [Vibrio sp. 10N.261.55.A7]|uniref:DNA mismatch repair protein n=1 Tax=Vibrio sp. 10N.261.55.A7 TaxID=1880851 RepID=UPI000C831B1B|nr:DNA mismatch repair protein [Vibrio sp. 10N.261.55.A7]PMJ92968.1 DNA mismatch repair protein [Vibrio sp. 10N.261.55.A7]
MRLRFPPAWVLVLIGLVLNILAILMSSVVLDKLGEQIKALETTKQQNLYSIQLAWKTVETLERKRESLLLHAQLTDSNDISNALQEALQGQLSDWVDGDVPLVNKENLSTLMMLINQAQQKSRNQIDDYYLDNLSLTDTMQSLSERIAWYKNIGLFLQVFGLALILSRDLAMSPLGRNKR